MKAHLFKRLWRLLFPIPGVIRSVGTTTKLALSLAVLLSITASNLTPAQAQSPSPSRKIYTGFDSAGCDDA